MSYQGTEEQQNDGAVALQAEAPETPRARTICGLTFSLLTALKLLVVVLLITGIVLGLTVGNLDSRLGDLLRWLEDNRVEGIAIYIALYAGLTGTLLNTFMS